MEMRFGRYGVRKREKTIRTRSSLFLNVIVVRRRNRGRRIATPCARLSVSATTAAIRPFIRAETSSDTTWAAAAAAVEEDVSVARARFVGKVARCAREGVDGDGRGGERRKKQTRRRRAKKKNRPTDRRKQIVLPVTCTNCGIPMVRWSF